jgi:hypothetical protein
MNTKFPLFLMAIALVLSCNRCKEECDDASNPECPNYVAPPEPDPCSGAELTSAEFQTFQDLPIPNELDSLVEFYTYCFTGADITLHAVQNSAEYQWIIGGDNYYTQDVTFSFSSQWAGQSIPLKLILTRTPDSGCYPNDNGVDTLTKVIIPRNQCDASFWGTFYGAWEDQPNDSFEISFSHEATAGCYPLMIGGAKPGVAPCEANESYYTDNYIVIEGSPGWCYWPLGIAKLDSSLQNIKFDYSMIVNLNQSEPREYHVFKGYKIN